MKTPTEYEEIIESQAAMIIDLQLLLTRALEAVVKSRAESKEAA